MLQDGRAYILDTGQKVLFERLKPQQNAPPNSQLPFVTGEIVVVIDPEPGRSVEAINDDLAQHSK